MLQFLRKSRTRSMTKFLTKKRVLGEVIVFFFLYAALRKMRRRAVLHMVRAVWNNYKQNRSWLNYVQIDLINCP